MNHATPSSAREHDRPQAAPRSSAWPDLQLCENLPQQRLEWTIQRVAWIFLYALLAAIACGLMGQGPLARARAGSADTAELEYQRFRTAKSSTDLTFTLAAVSGEARLHLSGDYLRQVDIKQVSPEPVRTIARPDGLVFVFAVESRQRVQVRLSIEPQSPGLLEGWFAAAGDKQHFRQFIYP